VSGAVVTLVEQVDVDVVGFPSTAAEAAATA
jgi:hypothetical protein